MSRRTWTPSLPVGCALGLLLMTLAVYGEVVNHPFHIRDDRQYVVQNPVVQRGLSLGGVGWAFAQVHALGLARAIRHRLERYRSGKTLRL